MRTKFFVNLTNGIEILPSIQAVDWSFTRIQSTACEQKRWDFIVRDLDHDLLMSTALGLQCVIVDFSQKKRIPRAIYQGIPWIRYALRRAWYDSEPQAYVKQMKVTQYFAEQWHLLTKEALSKLRYYRKFVRVKDVTVVGVSWTTMHDGEIDWHKRVLETYLSDPPTPLAGTAAALESSDLIEQCALPHYFLDEAPDLP